MADHVREIHDRGAAWRDIAVLVRRNADADPYLRSFNIKQIPFRFSGSRGLYQQEEIKVVVAFIRALTDFENSRDLFYLALSDVYKAGPYDLSRIAGHAEKKNLSLHDVFKAIAEDASPVEIAAETAETVKRIFADIRAFSELAATQNAGAVVYAFLERTGYLKSLVEPMTLESEVRVKNLRLFFDKIRGFSDLVENDSIRSFARYLDLLGEVGDNPATSEAELDEDAVNVLTVHKAKGLEFGTVFLVGLIEDRFPGRERRERIPVPEGVLKETLPGRENYLQEERRLFYVAMTRARRALHLTWARDYGVRRLKKISPFVLEALDVPKLPEEVLRASVLEDIRRSALSPGRPAAAAARRPGGTLRLSHVRVEDYLVCPLKYKFRHEMKVPVLPHHSLVFGRVLHETIHAYLKMRLKGRAVDEQAVVDDYAKKMGQRGLPQPRARGIAQGGRRTGPAPLLPAGGGLGAAARLPGEAFPLAGGGDPVLGTLRPDRFRDGRPGHHRLQDDRGGLRKGGRKGRGRQPAAGRLRPILIEDGGDAPGRDAPALPRIRHRRPGGERREGAQAGGREDPRGGRRHPRRRLQGPPRLAQLLGLRL